jgi:lysophospholipase L1-like esterase
VRFDRDVLGQTGATHVLIWEGPNDLGVPLAFGILPEISAEEVINGLEQLALRARAAGLTVIGGTITPFNGFPFPNYWTEAAETKRLEINAWIRSTDVFDAFVDFDAAVSDGNDPAQIRVEFSSDNLHFNAAGYKALADAIPLKLLTTRRTIKNNQ